VGVKVALLVSLQPVRQHNDPHGEGLNEYACRDRWGIPYTTFAWPDGASVTGGYGRGERRVWLNPGHPSVRRSLVTHLAELVRRGIDGFHLQDFFARPLDFNPTTGRTADRASWEGGIACLQEILRACRAIKPEFSVSTDTLWDRLLPVTLNCSVEAGETSALRTAFPSIRPTFTVAGEDSLGAIAEALRSQGRLRIAPENGEPMGGSAMANTVGYLRAVLEARAVLGHTLLDGVCLGATGLRVKGTVTFALFRNNASGLRSAVLINPGVNASEPEVSGFVEPSGRPVLVWQPGDGVRRLDFPARLKIPGRRLALITEEAADERLASIPRWAAPKSPRARIIFDLASVHDLQGWTLQGTAFSVSPLGALLSRPTLNSLRRSGESATGSALSPPFTIDRRFDRMEIVFHGGRSYKQQGKENLVVRLLDAHTGAVLEEILPPGTHELTARTLALDRLRGTSVRLVLVDENRASSYAWIGLRSVSLLDAPPPSPEE
jgi:hypothetical protein